MFGSVLNVIIEPKEISNYGHSDDKREGNKSIKSTF